MKSWQETKGIPEPELVSHIVAACQEVGSFNFVNVTRYLIKINQQIPVLKEQLLNKERQLNDLTNNQSKSMLLGNFHEAMVETKRQYDAIDRALEVI